MYVVPAVPGAGLSASAMLASWAFIHLPRLFGFLPSPSKW